VEPGECAGSGRSESLLGRPRRSRRRHPGDLQDPWAADRPDSQPERILEIGRVRRMRRRKSLGFGVSQHLGDMKPPILLVPAWPPGSHALSVESAVIQFMPAAYKARNWGPSG